jgi:hypothetical protein
MTVEEAIAARYADQPGLAKEVLGSVRSFVALAERKERESGRLCTIRVEF